MAQRRLRVALDANVLIAGIRLPRWPHAVLRASLGDSFDLALPTQVIVEASRHLTPQAQIEALQFFLDASPYEELPIPSVSDVRRNVDLIRGEREAPIALALLQGLR